MKLEFFLVKQVKTPTNLFKIPVYLLKMSKIKGTLRIQKSSIEILVLNQSPNSTVFVIVRFPGGAKTVLSGESLYIFFELVANGRLRKH